MSLQLDPPSRLMAMAAPVPVPTVQVMSWGEPTGQFSPPLGAITVGGVGGVLMVKAAFEVSAPSEVVTLISACVVAGPLTVQL